MWSRKTLARWFSVNPTARVGGVAAATILGVAGLFGGLDTAPVSTRVDTVAPDTEITVQPFTLKLKQAVALDEIEGVLTPRTPGNHLMSLLVDATNLADSSLGTYLLSPVPRAKSYMDRNLVVLDDRVAPSTTQVYDAESDISMSQLSPGLTYRLALVWEFGGPVPRELPLGLMELTLRGNTIAPDELEWQDDQEAAVVTLPVNDLTEKPA